MEDITNIKNKSNKKRPETHFSFRSLLDLALTSLCFDKIRKVLK